jgi:predicted DNA-binding transcriptional regulator YafY
VGLNERQYQFQKLLRRDRAVSRKRIMEALEISRSTFKRDYEFLRDRQGIPVFYDNALRGYRLREPTPEFPRQELPGLWFDSRELHALLAFHHFLEDLQPGLLSEHVAPLRKRIEALLDGKDRVLPEITKRVRIIAQANRCAEPACFAPVARALLTRKRLGFQYHGRGKGDVTDRVTSPQHLVHYRDNWYLDAWDHGKRALRTFAVECIRQPRVLDVDAKNIGTEKLKRHFTSSYGIFAGKPKRKAVLRFSPQRARWVADERWHPDQAGRFDGERYVLEIPYSDDRELVLDILKYGADVEVLKPQSLRERVAKQLSLALARYAAAK